MPPSPFRWRWPNGFVCPDCGQSTFCELKCCVLFQCNHCHPQTSLTSGTIFASTKLPIATWFLGIYLMTQFKTSVSALSLSRTLGITSNTALLMKHKLQQVMKLHDDSKPLVGLVQIDDSYWGGKNMTAIAVEEPPVKSRLLLPLQPATKGIR